MTVQTEFHSWQESPREPDPNMCSPINVTYMAYLTGTWGGQNLGCYASRPIIGGSTPSSHSSGSACDWRYEDPGPGRTVLLNEILPFLIDNSLELGIQAIHDYVGCRIWRPPGTSGRPSEPSPECGWKAQSPGSQMGQSWAKWIHVECLDSRWLDIRSVEEMLATEEDEVTDADIRKIVDLVKEELPAAILRDFLIDTTKDDGSEDKQSAEWLLDRQYDIVRRHLGARPKEVPDVPTLQRIDDNVKKLLP